MHVDNTEVDWRKVTVLSIVAAAVPWLLGLAAKRQIDRANRPEPYRWTDANRWEK